MEYLGTKLHTLTGPALSRVNDLKQKGPSSEQKEDLADGVQVESSAINRNLQSQYSQQADPQARGAPRRQASGSRDNQQGFLFGGETYSQSQLPPPPPIGFKLSSDGRGVRGSAGETPEFPGRPTQQQWDGKDAATGESRQSLYEGDAWTRLWFQRVMLLSLVRLLIFVRKVYEDFHATKVYRTTPGFTGHFIISAATLFLPTIVFTIYRVSRYLQFALPRLAVTDDTQAAGSYPPPVKGEASNGDSKEDEDTQLRKALISSPVAASASAARSVTEDDGLVTARQTPTQLEEYHDSRSQQDQRDPLGASPSPAPSTAIVKDSPPSSSGVAGGQLRPPTAEPQEEFKERVKIDKLGRLPDKETTRIVIGASEQILHGVLFVFWQLKRQVDVLGYLVERSCLWRRPSENEKEQLARLRTGSDGLEWFQDFYAAFLAILAQVYTLGLHWSSDGKNLSATNINAALGSSILDGSLSSDKIITDSARQLSNTLNQQMNLMEADALVVSQLLISSAVVFSLLIAVRRQDDGPMTLGCSMLGWGSLFAARILILALAFVHIGWRLMLPLVVAHVLGITGWIYKIALDSHNDVPSESEEYIWDDYELETNPNQATDGSAAERGESKRSQPEDDQVKDTQTKATSRWLPVQHVVLLAQIVTLFAIPSLFYWPIMFNLKLHYRPFKYLVLILSENFILIPAIWFSIAEVNATPAQWYLLGAVGGFSVLGFIFVSLYVACKPTLTEYFARADEIFNGADKSGVYYEFCSRVFKMPDLSKQTFRRLMNQSEIQQIEAVEIQE